MSGRESKDQDDTSNHRWSDDVTVSSFIYMTGSFHILFIGITYCNQSVGVFRDLSVQRRILWWFGRVCSVPIKDLTFSDRLVLEINIYHFPFSLTIFLTLGQVSTNLELEFSSKILLPDPEIVYRRSRSLNFWGRAPVPTQSFPGKF